MHLYICKWLLHLFTQKRKKPTNPIIKITILYESTSNIDPTLRGIYMYKHSPHNFCFCFWTTFAPTLRIMNYHTNLVNLRTLKVYWMASLLSSLSYLVISNLQVTCPGSYFGCTSRSSSCGVLWSQIPEKCRSLRYLSSAWELWSQGMRLLSNMAH